MNDLSINSVFYKELLECWLEFWNLFLADNCTWIWTQTYHDLQLFE